MLPLDAPLNKPLWKRWHIKNSSLFEEALRPQPRPATQGKPGYPSNPLPTSQTLSFIIHNPPENTSFWVQIQYHIPQPPDVSHANLKETLGMSHVV
ncbi:hypothetical protein P7K49_002657, partial [Saguinus oedipus]